MSAGNESWICRRKKKLQTTLDTYVKLKPSASMVLPDRSRSYLPLKEHQNTFFSRQNGSLKLKASPPICPAGRANRDQTASSTGSKRLVEKSINLADSGFHSSFPAKSDVKTPNNEKPTHNSPNQYTKDVVKYVFDQIANKTPETWATPSPSRVIYVRETPVIVVKPYLGVDKAVSVPDLDESDVTGFSPDAMDSKTVPNGQNSVLNLATIERGQALLQSCATKQSHSSQCKVLKNVDKGGPLADFTDSKPEKDKILHVTEQLLAQSESVDKISPIKSTKSATPQRPEEAPSQTSVSDLEIAGPSSPVIAPKFSINDSIFNESYNCFKKTSDRPPFAYKSDVVRKRDERKKLCGFACNCCKAYFDALDLPPEEKQRRIQAVSKHRDLQTPPATPDHFWEVGFPSSAELAERHKKYYAHAQTRTNNETSQDKFASNRLYTRKSSN